jgi:hypothetical protein
MAKKKTVMMAAASTKGLLKALKAALGESERLRAAIVLQNKGALRRKGGLEFTYDDMKEIFLEGGRHGAHAHPAGFERVMRSSFPQRYARKPKAKAA